MPKDRQWLTEGEIRSIAHDEIRDAIRLQTEILTDFKRLLDKIADGAQAQIFSATILHGNKEAGVKGAIPEMQERLSALECDLLSVKEEQKEAATKAVKVSARTDLRLTKIEANQHKIWNWVVAAFRVVAKNREGETDWKRLIGIAGAMGAAFHVTSSYIPRWATIHAAAAKLAEAFAKSFGN